jgi:Ca2+-binding EF-hand superfamily protein
MKYVAVLAALGLGSAALMVNSEALAQQGQGRHGAFMERLKAADTNADGKLSREEAAALPHISQHFDEIDANHDGYVTFDELQAFARAHHGRHGAGHGLKALDKDGDGKISREEAAAAPHLAKNFDRIDTNHDGFITPDELGAAHQAMRKAHWARIDTDGDGRISRAEAQANAPRLAEHFDQVDANGDGFITPEELTAAMRAHHGERSPQ